MLGVGSWALLLQYIPFVRHYSREIIYDQGYWISRHILKNRFV